MSPVAVLFARHDSIYKRLGCDVYDKSRDARTYAGGGAVIAHPPCALWGRLRHMSSRPNTERRLAFFAVEQVRRWGGVLEHPHGSQLWGEAHLPAGEKPDRFGGWTLSVSQYQFGHRAEKRTLLYIVGCSPRDLPRLPVRPGLPAYIVGSSGRRRDGSRLPRREIRKAEREHTPEPFARWLLKVARHCNGR